MQETGRLLLAIAAILAVAGLVFLLLGRAGLGRLPGDIVVRRDDLTIHIPLASMIIVSIVASIVWSLVRRL